MALFPRKIDGKYAMIARQDNENLYLIYSDDLYQWDGGQAILKPQFPWEFVQIGNCGSPIELDEGWLLLTHGVGPVRKYSIGAALLDKNDPSKVLARSVEPLLHPEPSEREGMFPTWSIPAGDAHNDQIILPTRIGHLLQLCDHQDCSPDAGDDLNQLAPGRAFLCNPSGRLWGLIIIAQPGLLLVDVKTLTLPPQLCSWVVAGHSKIRCREWLYRQLYCFCRLAAASDLLCFMVVQP
jgi:hypothetical protein